MDVPHPWHNLVILWGQYRFITHVSTAEARGLSCHYSSTVSSVVLWWERDSSSTWLLLSESLQTSCALVGVKRWVFVAACSRFFHNTTSLSKLFPFITYVFRCNCYPLDSAQDIKVSRLRCTLWFSSHTDTICLTLSGYHLPIYSWMKLTYSPR